MVVRDRWRIPAFSIRGIRPVAESAYPDDDSGRPDPDGWRAVRRQQGTSEDFSGNDAENDWRHPGDRRHVADRQGSAIGSG